MSRSGYTDDYDYDEYSALAYGRWRGQLMSSIRGKNGQAFLKELLLALDEMPTKELYPNAFQTADGEFCALGVLACKYNLKTDDLVYESSYSDEVECCTEAVGHRFGIAHQLAAEIMELNDNGVDPFLFERKRVPIFGPFRYYWEKDYYNEPVVDIHAPKKRWQYVRNWVAKQIKQDKE